MMMWDSGPCRRVLKARDNRTATAASAWQVASGNGCRLVVGNDQRATRRLCAPAADRCSSRRRPGQANPLESASAHTSGCDGECRRANPPAGEDCRLLWHTSPRAPPTAGLGRGDLVAQEVTGSRCNTRVRAGTIAHADRRRQPTTSTGVVAASTSS
jgi:hypothetical protein